MPATLSWAPFSHWAELGQGCPLWARYSETPGMIKLELLYGSLRKVCSFGFGGVSFSNAELWKGNFLSQISPRQNQRSSGLEEVGAPWCICWLKKKCTTWKLTVKFYWGPNEDLSLGHSISGSPEKLLWGDEGGARMYRSFFQQREGSENKRWRKTRYLELRNSGLFYGQMQRSGLTGITPLLCTSAVWGQFSLFLSRAPSGLTGSPLGVAALTDDCDIFLFRGLNCSQGGSVSDSGDVLPQRGKGKYYQGMCQRGGGGVCSQTHISQNFAAGEGYR